MECVLETPQKKAEYLQKGNFKYQTRDVRLFVQFKKNYKTKNYNINKALFDARIEIVPEKNNPFNFYVGYSFNLLDAFNNNDTKLKKASVNKDLFNLTNNHSEHFWDQNLPIPTLTLEQEEILKKTKVE